MDPTLPTEGGGLDQVLVQITKSTVRPYNRKEPMSVDLNLFSRGKTTGIVSVHLSDEQALELSAMLKRAAEAKPEKERWWDVR